jgi:hypothetical protein
MSKVSPEISSVGYSNLDLVLFVSYRLFFCPLLSSTPHSPFVYRQPHGFLDLFYNTNDPRGDLIWGVLRCIQMCIILHAVFVYSAVGVLHWDEEWPSSKFSSSSECSSQSGRVGCSELFLLLYWICYISKLFCQQFFSENPLFWPSGKVQWARHFCKCILHYMFNYHSAEITDRMSTKCLSSYIYIFLSSCGCKDVEIGSLKMAAQYVFSIGAYGWAGEGRPSVPRRVSTFQPGKWMEERDSPWPV